MLNDRQIQMKNIKDKNGVETVNIEKIEDLEIENNTYFLDRLFGNLIQNAIFYNN